MQQTIELFKSALENEIKASVFYEKAAEATHDDSARMLFLELSSFEDGHINRIIEMAHAHNLGNQDELKQFIAQMEDDAESTLTVDETDILDTGDLDAIFRFAVDIENKARQAYEDLAAHSNDKDFQEFCEEMVAEEVKHASQLEHERQSLQLDIEDRPPL